MKLTLRRDWMEPDYVPASLFESPFVEMPHEPRFVEVLDARHADPYQGSLESFAHDLVAAVDAQLAKIKGAIHLLLSGGYDSRILAALLERAGREPLFVTDGMERPSSLTVRYLLNVPADRCYQHNMYGFDPYGLADATCDGFAALYQMHRFMPGDGEATLVSGLGGGEWFSYPASGWLNGKPRRLPGDDVVAMWLDCWPQYTLIPSAWAQGYKAALHPYCTLEYAQVAAQCRPEWLKETPGNQALDLVRGAMLAELDERLLEPAWMPHVYCWNLSDEQKQRIDERFFGSPVSEFHRPEFGLPSQMDEAAHACALAGFATWCDKLAADHELGFAS